MKIALSLLVYFGFVAPAHAACETRLWSAQSLERARFELLPAESRAALLNRAAQLLTVAPAPVETLRSAGVVNPGDPQLLATRRAFQDGDHAALLALAYRLTGDAQYGAQLRKLFTSWAQTNKPTGHPIDETRLDGLVWAYDAVRCELPTNEADAFAAWLNALQQKKAAWQFGPSSQLNNHYTHHLKMRLLLARVLNDEALFNAMATAAEAHARVNLDAHTGESVDYRERNAVHYHNYDMAAWNEIVVLTGCCKARVQRGNEFLTGLIERDEIHHEFAMSQASIDRQRAAAGFEYARADSTFAVEKISPTIFASLIWSSRALSPRVRQIVDAQRHEPRSLFYSIRENLWNAAAQKAQR